MRIRVQTIYSREHNLFSIMPKQYFQLKICSYFKALVQTGIIKKITSTGKDPDPGKWYKKWIVGSFRSRQMHCSCFFFFLDPHSEHGSGSKRLLNVDSVRFRTVLWIRNDLFRIRIQLWPFPSSGCGSRQKFQIHADPDPTYINKVFEIIQKHP